MRQSFDLAHRNACRAFCSYPDQCVCSRDAGTFAHEQAVTSGLSQQVRLLILESFSFDGLHGAGLWI